MKNDFGQFNEEALSAFKEAANERYDYAACRDGEKMTFGKCQKVGDSKKDDEVALTRQQRNLNRLDNQRRRESGRSSKYTKKGFKK